MIRSLFIASTFFGLVLSRAIAAEPRDPFAEVFKKVEARFEPAEAKPGQSVVLKVELKLGNGWITYPTRQPEESGKRWVNRIVLPQDGLVTFTGKIKEPEKPTIFEEPMLGIKNLHTYRGGGIWECAAIVSTKAPSGLQTIKVKFAPLIHSAEICGPKKKFDLEATIKVIGEPTQEKK